MPPEEIARGLVKVSETKEGVVVTATVGVPVAEVTVIFEPAAIVCTPIFVIVGVPVAEETAMPVPAVRDCTPLFVIVMEFVVVEMDIFPAPVRAIVEVEIPASWLRMP